MPRRATLVGINKYQQLSDLKSCCNDVEALRRLLATNWDNRPNFECKAYCADEAPITRRRLITIIKQALAPGVNVALFYFAGHGLPQKGDLELAGQDSQEAGSGFSVSQLLGLIKESKVPEVIVMLDCCYSGAAGQVPQIGGEVVVIRQGLSFLTACRGDQTAAEENGRGKFSKHLCSALEGGAANVAGIVDVGSVYQYVSERFGAFEQRPTFLASMSRPQQLRQTQPSVSIDELSRLPKLFVEATSILPLSPAYEPTVEPRNDRKQEEFALLQRYRAARLVVPVDAEHLYFAAMNSKGCRLTALGRHYWRLAKAKRLG